MTVHSYIVSALTTMIEQPTSIKFVRREMTVLRLPEERAHRVESPTIQHDVENMRDREDRTLIAEESWILKISFVATHENIYGPSIVP